MHEKISILLLPLLLCFLSYSPLVTATNASSSQETQNKIYQLPTSTKNIEAENLDLALFDVIEKQKAIISSLQGKQQQLQEQINKSEGRMSFSVWVSVLLACVTIIVTVFGVIVALVTFFGFKNVKESAIKSAEELSTSVASEVARNEANQKINEVAKKEIAFLLDNGELKEHLESAVDLIVRRQIKDNGSNGFSKYLELDLEEEQV
ncbi:hypothetical protein J7H99_003397 [Vibrio parahaemolyticus]|nr:hypothetical protein [Vibrio parahaemolyticus]